MQVQELMTKQVISIRQDETADVAARLLGSHNIGAAPVVDREDKLVGMLTDRDLVVRCMAAGLQPERVDVSQIMTPGPMTASPEEDAAGLTARMGREQIRRVPVVQEGRLAGIVSLADLARGGATGAAEALRQISGNISRR